MVICIYFCVVDCSTSPIDLGFVLDGSGSIEDKGVGNWDLVINFVDNIIDRFDVGSDKTRVGLVAFSNQAQLKIPLNKFYNKTALKIATQDPTIFGRGRTNMQVCKTSQIK